MAEQNEMRPMTIEDWYQIKQGQQVAAAAREEALIGLVYDAQSTEGWVVLYPRKELPDLVLKNNEPNSFIALPVKDVPYLADKYIRMVETETTNRMCRCEWIVHPDDVEKPEGTRRVTRGGQATNCPIHTKLGFLLYFFDWAFKSECEVCPPDCHKCTYRHECACHPSDHKSKDEHYEDDDNVGHCVCGAGWVCPDWVIAVYGN